MTRLLAALLFLSPLPAHAQYTTAKSMSAACQSTGEVEQAVCASYISGVVDAVILSGVLGCAPADYDREAIQRAAETELAKADTNGTAMKPIFDAVMMTFPCEPLTKAP